MDDIKTEYYDNVWFLYAWTENKTILRKINNFTADQN